AAGRVDPDLPAPPIDALSDETRTTRMRQFLRTTRNALAVVALSVVLTLGAAVALGGSPADRIVAGRVEAVAVGQLGTSDRSAAIDALQVRLRAQPKDHRAWSSLALAYVEQARVTVDPTYYPKAERALRRAARLKPGDDLLLTGRATLAAARHDFTAALSLADRALRANPYSAQAHAVRSDALTELGRYQAALAAATRADRLEPGDGTFARLSYQAELRGDLGAARRLMRRAQLAAAAPESYAFAAAHLGELARAAGDEDAAARHFAVALDADPFSAAARVGRARLAVARGDIASAEGDYLAVVRRLALPEYVVELGELYQATGRPDQAARQYAVAAAAAALSRSNGVGTDLETALFEADHGSPRHALLAARAEWGRRHSIHTADALAWALHAAGRSAEALPYARRATELGSRDARILFHRGVIEAAAGDSAQARRSLAATLDIDAGIHPLRTEQARAVLAELGVQR
ncbi:MAG: tetratricopeptide repeat protein, partial [Sporichthyaceae bacterium]